MARALDLRVDVRVSAEQRAALERVADLLGVDVASYCREASLRAAADDLPRLLTLLGSDPRPTRGTERGTQVRPPSDTRYQKGDGGPTPVRPEPGTARALSGEEEDEEASSSSPETDDSVPDELEEAVDWRQREVEASGQVIGVPESWRATVRARLERDTKQVQAILARKRASQRPKVRPPGRDPT